MILAQAKYPLQTVGHRPNNSWNGKPVLPSMQSSAGGLCTLSFSSGAAERLTWFFARLFALLEVRKVARCQW